MIKRSKTEFVHFQPLQQQGKSIDKDIGKAKHF